MPVSSRHVAFLRGINVGRAKRVAMADLRSLTEELGHTDVRTHLQSGNVVFTAAAGAGGAAGIERDLEGAIERTLGLDVDVVVRTRAQIDAIVRRDPLSDVATDLSRYLVLFLSAKPAASTVSAIDAASFEPERFAVHGREIYLWAPNGVHVAKLPKQFEKFGVVATGRNWNTVTRIAELLAG